LSPIHIQTGYNILVLRVLIKVNPGGPAPETHNSWILYTTPIINVTITVTPVPSDYFLPFLASLYSSVASGWGAGLGINRAPCRFRGCKSRPAPFPGRMSYKVSRNAFFITRDILSQKLFHCDVRMC